MRGRCAIIVAILALIIGLTRTPAASAPSPGYSSTEIHVKFRQSTAPESPELLLPADLRNSLASITRLFGGIPAEKLDKMKEFGEGRGRKKLPDLNLWFKITLKPGSDPSDFIEKLKRLDGVEHAEFAPLPAPPPAITPDFKGNQGYLDIGPGGIDALFSSIIPGGNGSGVKIYDVEYSWNQTHEDLSKANGILLLLDTGDFAVDPFNDNNHGTAVLGELIADNDTKGVTGISYGADIGLAPANTAHRGYNPANAILLAVGDGVAGDVILIEQQAFVCGLPNFGPSESISSVFDAIQIAVANGFLVVEAAGNGNVNLDQAACGTVFDRTVRDSGAIIVGAGKPPSSGADREREPFSTYGSRVDLQG
jgi:serine protease